MEGAVAGAESDGFGLQHTQAWLVLHVRLQRLLQCLQSSSTPHEREALKNHFASQLVEQAKQYSVGAERAPPAPEASSTSGWQATNELNSLALLAVANMFDRLITPRQQTAPQVRAICGPLAAGKEDDAVLSAWSLFMQQASSTLGSLSSGWAAAAATAGGLRSSCPPSPMSPMRRPLPNESPGPTSPVPPGRGDVGSNGLPRNGSEIFSFEQ